MGCSLGSLTCPPARGWPRAASALRMSRREMLGERQVAAPLMAQRAAHGALGLAHRRLQPGEGVGIQLAGFRLSGRPQRPSPCQFGHETLVLAFALFAPAALRPGQHRAVWRQRGRQAAPCGHASTVGQRFVRLVLRDDQEERRRTSSSALAGRILSVRVAAHVMADLAPCCRDGQFRQSAMVPGGLQRSFVRDAGLSVTAGSSGPTARRSG